MKCRLIRNDLDVDMKGPQSDEFVEANSAECLSRFEPPYRELDGDEIVTRPGKPVRQWKWGTLIDHPLAWQLVAQGVAIPNDDECREACGLTPEQITDAQNAYDHLKEHGSYMDELSVKQVPIEDDDEL